MRSNNLKIHIFFSIQATNLVPWTETFTHFSGGTPLSDAYNPLRGHELEVMVTNFVVSDSCRLFTQNIFGG